MSNLFYIFIAIILVFMNAFFVAAEFAMVKLRYTRVAVIKRTYGLRGKILAYIHKHLDAYLSACQLGITLASLGLGWVGEPAFAVLLSPLFELTNVANDVKDFLAFFIAFTILSFLHIVVGELMPKSLAIRQSEKISLWTAVPLYMFYWLMYPAIWLLNTCANFLLKITGLDKTHQREYFYSTDEIKVILSASHLHGELTKDETEILEHTLDFADLKVTEVMRPHEEMVAINLSDPLDTILQMVTNTRYSRYPIFDKNSKDIIGIIHIKDLFAALYKELTIKSLQPFIRPILKVSSRIQAIDLLRKFREGMPHFALVYRGENILGFVTLDNLLHVLIGRIKDEFHRTQDDWMLNPDGTLIVKGDCPISSLERALGREITIEKNFGHPTVIAGLIVNKLGRPPYEGERIDFKEFKVTIKKMNGPRIIKIKIYPKTKPKEEDDHILIR